MSKAPHAINIRGGQKLEELVLAEAQATRLSPERSLR